VKLALLSDIHGNAEALERALDAARDCGAERILCAGDCVGYYYEPARCLDLLDSWSVEYVTGNHEEMLRQSLDDGDRGEEVRRRYGSGLSIALRELTMDRLRRLTTLPSTRTIKFDDTTVLLCHGSPWDVDTYVYPDAPPDSLDRCAAAGTDVVVMGHTHYRFARRWGRSLLINPGSVGQPRDRIPGAAWALLDTETGVCTLQTEAYDCSGLIARARATDPHLPYLWEVLSRS
jgi:putative phosphoesterase